MVVAPGKVDLTEEGDRQDNGENDGITRDGFVAQGFRQLPDRGVMPALGIGDEGLRKAGQERLLLHTL